MVEFAQPYNAVGAAAKDGGEDRRRAMPDANAPSDEIFFRGACK
jgi:hypothetical protein